jgi:predicted NUDIX family phosphoesterase
LKQSRTIVESRNELIGQARGEAESIVRQAQQQAKELVAQEAIYQEARRQCQEMYNKTQARIAELRTVSNDYMDDALRRTEEAVLQSLNEVRDTRVKFKALAEAQDKKAGIAAAQD